MSNHPHLGPYLIYVYTFFLQQVPLNVDRIRHHSQLTHN